MVPLRVALRSSGSIHLRSVHVRYLFSLCQSQRSCAASTLRRANAASLGQDVMDQRYGVGQTAGRSGEESTRPSSAPTSMPSDRRCSTFVSGTSLATLLLPKQCLVCCADRLNPPPKADLRANGLVARNRSLAGDRLRLGLRTGRPTPRMLRRGKSCATAFGRRIAIFDSPTGVAMQSRVQRRSFERFFGGWHAAVRLHCGVLRRRPATWRPRALHAHHGDRSPDYRGGVKGPTKEGGVASGDISCEYATASGPRWISVRLHDGDLPAWKRRNGGASPIALPDLGKDAFANADAEGSADVYAAKGKLVLRVTMPKGPQAVDMDKAIAKKALARLP